MENITLKCNSCSVEKNFKRGRENGEDSLEAAMDHFKGKTKLHIRALQKHNTIDDFDFGYEIYACPKCKTLRNPYSVQVEYDNMMMFKPFHKCHECNTTLEKATEPYTEYCCSGCGKDGLQQVKF